MRAVISASRGDLITVGRLSPKKCRIHWCSICGGWGQYLSPWDWIEEHLIQVQGDRSLDPSRASNTGPIQKVWWDGFVTLFLLARPVLAIDRVGG